MINEQEFSNYIYQKYSPPVVQIKKDGEVVNYTPSAVTLFPEIAKGVSFFGIFPNLGKSVLSSRKEFLLHDSAGERMSVDIDEREEFFILKFIRVADSESSESAGEESFHRLVDKLQIGISEFDLNGQFTFCNEACYRMFGYDTASPIIGHMNVLDVIPPEARDAVTVDIVRLVHSGVGEPVEYIGMRKDGSRFPIEIHSNVFTRGGIPAGIRGIIIDLTNKKKTEGEIVHTNKLESLGLLAGGIAHDFNNILTVIIGNISLAKFDLEPGCEMYNLLEEVETASQKAKSLTQQLLSFSRGREPIKEKTDIDELVRQSSLFVLSGTKASIDFAFDENLWSVEVDRGQISRAVQNIVMNAVQSMSGSGVISIAVNNVRVTSADDLPLRFGKYIRVKISDKGCGIKKEYLKKVFDPYFTTKEGASGLGLSVAYSLLKSHKGCIRLESSPNEGTSVSVYIPALPSKGDADFFDASVRATKMLNILVVDDEEPLRKVAGEMIKMMGHVPFFASNADEALALAGASLETGNHMDIIIVDLTIAGKMTASDIVAAVNNLYPVKSIVVSGYSNDPAIENYISYGFDASITKPFSIDEIRAAVYSVTHG